MIKSIELINYRNIKKLVLNFSSRETIIIWNNWHWKSSILEAIYFLSIWKAYRSKSWHDTIKFWEDFAQIIWSIENWESDPETLEQIGKPLFIWFSTKPRVKIKYKLLNHDISAFAFLWNLNCVLFTPNDLRIITWSPSERRGFLNSLLVRCDKNYAYILGNFLKVQSQRNALLKDIACGRCNKELIKIWNQKLVDFWYLIEVQRINLVNILLPLVNKFYSKISKNKDEYSIRLISNTFWDLNPEKKNYFDQIEKVQEKDILLWSTSIGPHRDDIIFTLNWNDMSQYCSQWEIRTWVLALKYAEVVILKGKKWNITLLLDDVFSELDEIRAKSLINLSKKFQTIITCTKPPQWYNWKLCYKICNWNIK